MKGRDHFTAGEAAEIRRLLDLIRRAQAGPPRKRLRDHLRGRGFYITDWRGGQAGFTRSDFDDLVAGGIVRVEGERPQTHGAAASPAKGRTARDHSSRASEIAAPRASGRLARQPAAEEGLIEDAHRSLSTKPMSIAAAFGGGVPNAAGLYAIYGSPAAWQQLDLGAPPDDRPLYVGKAETSLRSRDLATHFARVPAVRAHEPLRPAQPLQVVQAAGIGPKPGLGLAQRARIVLSGLWSGDIRSLVRLNGYPTTAVVARWLPPLNLTGVITPWRVQVKAARAAMAERAKVRARDRGLTG